MKKTISKIFVLVIVVISIFLFSAGKSLAEDNNYPNRPISFLLPYGPGGSTDIVYRAFLRIAEKYIGQTFIPINKPGGSGTVEAMAVSNSKPDGYTIGGATASQCLIAPFDPQAPFKDLDRFTFIMNFGGNLHVYLTRGDSPWKTWDELIEYARKHPKEVSVGVAGAKYNNYSGLLLSQVEIKEKINFTFMPFKSGAGIITALLGGHVDLYGTSMSANALEFIKTGRLRLLATADTKIRGFEDIPVFTDYKYMPEGISPHLLGVLAPKGLPESIVKKLETGFIKTAKDPEFVKFMKSIHAPLVLMGHSEMNEFIKTSFKEHGKLIKQVRGGK